MLLPLWNWDIMEMFSHCNTKKVNHDQTAVHIIQEAQHLMNIRKWNLGNYAAPCSCSKFRVKYNQITHKSPDCEFLVDDVFQLSSTGGPVGWDPDVRVPSVTADPEKQSARDRTGHAAGPGGSTGHRSGGGVLRRESRPGTEAARGRCRRVEAEDWGPQCRCNTLFSAFLFPFEIFP